jgi:hypothetical protein
MYIYFQVTDNHNIVLTQDVISETFPPDLMVMHIRRLVRERDEYLQVGFYKISILLVLFTWCNFPPAQVPLDVTFVTVLLSCSAPFAICNCTC